MCVWSARSLNWKGTEAALCFGSGYAAALGTIPALVTKNDVVLLDKLCHASLIDGAKLSGAILRVFPHSNLCKLESHLEWARREHTGKRVLIVTESVFSMDGDRAPLRELIQLKKRFSALLMLDEAHAVGVIGPNGRGLAAEQNLSDDIDVQMGTLSKAPGASGGYICAASSAIFPWIVGAEQAALDLAAALKSEGFLVPAIRYPTVAKDAARLRITVTAAHQEDQIEALCQAIRRNSASD
jgi:7-keto-8-aminopelargonate synthetase-like enzyme